MSSANSTIINLHKLWPHDVDNVAAISNNFNDNNICIITSSFYSGPLHWRTVSNYLDITRESVEST